MASNRALVRCNKLNQMDPMTQNVLGAAGYELDEQSAKINQLLADLFFDTCSEAMLKVYERECGIVASPSQSLEDRRSSVSAKWKSSGKIDIAMLQAVADSWQYGEVEVEYINDIIEISFVNKKGIPTDVEGLQRAIEEVKPAHLSTNYNYTYNTWADVSMLTWAEANASTWDGLKTR